jgi:CheY-like chemotaxis protein
MLFGIMTSSQTTMAHTHFSKAGGQGIRSTLVFLQRAFCSDQSEGCSPDLGKLGIRPEVAANGREAVEMSKMTPYDLIFMDCQMPELDGYAACREIRSREGRGHRITIVAMTAEAMGGSRELSIEAGMDDYISKPVKHSEISEALRKWLAPRATQNESSALPPISLRA